MTTPTVRGASQLASSGSPTVTLPLPAGVAAGDWGIVTLATGTAVTITIPSGWTYLAGPGIFGPTGSSTQYAVIGKQYASGDPANVVITLSSNPKWSVGGVWYQGAGGFGLPSTPAIRSTAGTTSTAPAASSAAAGQVVAVCMGEKSSTATTVTVAPTTTQDVNVFAAGTGEASVYMGHYTAAAAGGADRTGTYNNATASSNGFGVQVPIIDGAAPPPPPPPPDPTPSTSEVAFKVNKLGTWGEPVWKVFQAGTWKAIPLRVWDPVRLQWSGSLPSIDSDARKYLGVAASGGGPNVGVPTFSSSIDIPVDALVVVGVVGNGAAGLTGSVITDTAGNTYTEIAPSAASGAPVAATTLLWSRITNPIAVGDSWTLTIPTAARGKAAWVVSAFTGVLATPADKTATATGIGTAITTGPTATLTQANEIAIEVIGVGASDQPALGSGFRDAGTSATATGTNDRRVQVGFKLLSATTALTPSASLPGLSQTWATSLATFKSIAGAVAPPAPTTLFGMSFNSNEDPLPVETLAGGKPVGVRRTYFQSNQQSAAVTMATSDIAKGRIPWMSFKLPTSWADVAAGNQDTWAHGLINALDAVGGEIWIAFHHEPENDGPIADWVAMNARLLAFVKASTHLKATIILTGYPQFVDNSYPMTSCWPGDSVVDIVGYDPYNSYGMYPSTYGVGTPLTSWTDMDGNYYSKAQAWATAHHCRWAIAETGITDPAFSNPPAGKDGPGWMQAQYNAVNARGAIAWCYFDSFLNSRGYWATDQLPAKRQRLANVLANSP